PHAQLLRALLREFADQLLHVFLFFSLRARFELFVRDHLRGHWRINALLLVANRFTNPHMMTPCLGGWWLVVGGWRPSSSRPPIPPPPPPATIWKLIASAPARAGSDHRSCNPSTRSSSLPKSGRPSGR